MYFIIVNFWLQYLLKKKKEVNLATLSHYCSLLWWKDYDYVQNMESMGSGGSGSRGDNYLVFIAIMNHTAT